MNAGVFGEPQGASVTMIGRREAALKEGVLTVRYSSTSPS